MSNFSPNEDRHKRTKYDLRSQPRHPSYDDTMRRPKRASTSDSTLSPDDSASNLNNIVTQPDINVIASAFGTSNLLPVSSYKQEAAGVVSNLADFFNKRLQPHGAHLMNSDLGDFKDAIFDILDRVHNEAILTIATKDTENKQLRQKTIELEAELRTTRQEDQLQIQCLVTHLDNLKERAQKLEQQLDSLRVDSEWDFVNTYPTPSITDASYPVVSKYT